MTIIFSGGGTGGHIYPALGIAQSLQSLDPEIEIIFIGSADRLEATLVPQHRFKFLPIAIAGFPRKITLKWFSVLAKLFTGILQSLRLIGKFKPYAVVGTGGYVCGPVLLAAKLCNVPIVLQEQNARPGITSRISGHWATKIFVALKNAKSYFPSNAVVTTGNPIGASIGTVERNGEIYEKLKLDPDRMTIFVMGGSQGAKALNLLMVEALENLAPFSHRIQIVHQTGKISYDETCKAYEKFPLKKLVRPYFDRIEKIYAITDLMVCRAGGMTISEITACGLPAIFIPLPTATQDHQRLNAEAVVEAGAGVILPQRSTNGEELADKIISLFTNADRLRKMSEASKKIGNPNASRELAKSVLSLCKKGVK